MTMKKRKKEKTIFRTILFAMLLVLGIEIVLLVSALYLSNVSTRLNQNAMDLLDMQTSNRADYLESILLFNQDRTMRRSAEAWSLMACSRKERASFPFSNGLVV